MSDFNYLMQIVSISWKKSYFRMFQFFCTIIFCIGYTDRIVRITVMTAGSCLH